MYLRATFSPGDVSQPPKFWVLRQPLPTYVHDVRAVLAHKEIPEDYRKVCQGTSVAAGNVMCGSPIKNRPKSDDIHCCSGSRQPNVTRRYPRHRLPTPKASGDASHPGRVTVGDGHHHHLSRYPTFGCPRAGFFPTGVYHQITI